eukprot:753127-Hanusia_phi.AAC.2
MVPRTSPLFSHPPPPFTLGFDLHLTISLTSVQMDLRTLHQGCLVSRPLSSMVIVLSGWISQSMGELLKAVIFVLGEAEGIENLAFLDEEEIENETSGEEWLSKLSCHLKVCGEVDEEEG